MRRDVNKYEMEALRVCCGEKVPGFAWGAWVTECLESLQGMGLVTPPPRYTATEAGRAVVEAWRRGGGE